MSCHVENANTFFYWTNKAAFPILFIIFITPSIQQAIFAHYVSAGDK